MKVLSALAICGMLFSCALNAGAEVVMNSKYKTTFYGHIKSDIGYDLHGVSGDDYMLYVNSKKSTAKDFRISARGTRFGFKMEGENNVEAKIEMDFLGLSESVGGTSGATTDLRLRHAYVKFKFNNLDILAGQTWHLTPLELPGTNNELVFGYNGALWYRAPQLRASWKTASDMNLAIAIVRPTRKLTDAEGTASGIPQFQAQVQKKFGNVKLTLAGALGQWKNATTGDKGDINLIDLGFNVPFGDIFTVNGQIWTGKNLYDFLGGIGNMGYGTNSIKASGGFANLKIKPEGKVYYNIAHGMDNPVDKNLAVGDRAKSCITMANINTVHNNVTISFETAYQVTSYKVATGSDKRDNTHFQLSFKYPF